MIIAKRVTQVGPAAEDAKCAWCGDRGLAEVTVEGGAVYILCMPHYSDHVCVTSSGLAMLELEEEVK